jgi:hypothetical protein
MGRGAINPSGLFYSASVLFPVGMGVEEEDK